MGPREIARLVYLPPRFCLAVQGPAADVSLHACITLTTLLGQASSTCNQIFHVSICKRRMSSSLRGALAPLLSLPNFLKRRYILQDGRGGFAWMDVGAVR